MKYAELGYSLPTIDTETAANQAIFVLEEIMRSDPASLFYVMQASNILALAGLRAISTYNEFHPHFSTEKRAVLLKLLHTYGYEILMERDPYADIQERQLFSLVCVERMSDVPKQYAVVESFWKAPRNPASYTDFALWTMHIHAELVEQMDKNTLPKEWLNDWWAPHNIRFGMLLGYPGEAISSLCWSEAARSEEYTLAAEETLNMPFQGAYCGTHVVYDYASAIEDTSIFKEHAALWSDTLRKVYKVFSKSRLAQYPEFMTEYARYKAYDEQK